jgi:hypothetical protein
VNKEVQLLDVGDVLTTPDGARLEVLQPVEFGYGGTMTVSVMVMDRGSFELYSLVGTTEHHRMMPDQVVAVEDRP